MERDINCGIDKNSYTTFAFTRYLADADYITSNIDQLERYCSDRCWQAKVNYTTMFGNDACKDDVFEIGGINITASLLSQTPILKDTGYCLKVGKQYCAATDMAIINHQVIDFFTAQNKTFTCIDCTKPYSPNPTSTSESSKTLYHYQSACGPIQTSSAVRMNVPTINLVGLLMYLGL
ncbi:hypothetical protein BC833DRAFT_622141 [Globomyces pollinis-pini]|nr:hypothetical protein BC833DRAFT_622141 [Globomyces pollinis-pini]